MYRGFASFTDIMRTPAAKIAAGLAALALSTAFLVAVLIFPSQALTPAGTATPTTRPTAVDADKPGTVPGSGEVTPLPTVILSTATIPATSDPDNGNSPTPDHAGEPTVASTATPPASPTGVPTGTGGGQPQATATPWIIVVTATPSRTPRPTATSVPPTATPVVITDWKGEYFNNTSLSGAPVLVRNDGDVNFNWGGGSPATGVRADNFSARWTRTLNFVGGNYRFYATADDAVRVYLDGWLLIDQWHAYAPNTYSADFQNLGAGSHTVKVEYAEYSGVSQVKVWWQPIINITDWKGEYYNNTTLSGSPALVRNDTDVNFTWGSSSPDSAISSDNFSARWTRTLNFSSGDYRFYATADDAVRIYLDGWLLIDQWHAAGGNTYSADFQNLGAGPHTVTVEYAEYSGNAQVKLWWQQRPSTFSGWKGEYFNNINLSGSPVLVRDDANIDFDWGNSSPGAGVNADAFSARWTRTLNFERGNHLFVVTVDDGVRLYLDDKAVIDRWTDSRSTYSNIVFIPAGSHHLRLEYYERSGQAKVQFGWNKLNEPTATATATATRVPPTATATPIVVVPSATPTRVLPTATATRVPPTATATATQPAPTATATRLPPTATATRVAPTATATRVRPTVTPTATATRTASLAQEPTLVQCVAPRPQRAQVTWQALKTDKNRYGFDLQIRPWSPEYAEDETTAEQGWGELKWRFDKDRLYEYTARDASLTYQVRVRAHGVTPVQHSAWVVSEPCLEVEPTPMP